MKKTTFVLLAALVMVALMSVTASAQQVNQWSQYQKDVSHTGSVDTDLPDTNRVARRTPNITAVDSSEPVVDGNRAYVYAGVMGTSGAIYCYNLATGDEVWHTAVEPGSAFNSWSSPSVSNGTVYIASGSKVQALNGDSGTLLWTKDLTTIKTGAMVLNSSPAVHGNRLVIGDYQNGCYYCLDVGDRGKHLWTFTLDASCTAMSTACIDGGRVYVGQGAAFGAPLSPNGKVWCVDETTGAPVSSWGTAGCFATVGKLDMNGTVTAYGDFIYFTDFAIGAATEPNCYLYCLDRKTGVEKWKKKVYGSDGAPAVSEGFIVTAGQQPGAWPAPNTNWVTAFSADTTNGSGPVQKWSKSGMGGSNMSACLSGDRVAVGNTEMNASWALVGTDTYVLNAANGSTVWHSSEGGAAAVATPYGLLSIADGKMVTFGTGALPDGDYYFAEGCTRQGYEEWICLENPTGASVAATIEYMVNGGGTREQKLALAPNSRTSINSNAFVGPDQDVSAHVYGNGPFVAERSMYFTAGGLNGGEQVMGATDPGLKFLFAEGTTRQGFRTWLALQNPQDADANVLVTYLYGDGTPPKQQNVSVKAKSRETVDVNAGAGADKDVSIALTANRPVVGERVMYFQYPVPIIGSNPSGVHNCTGASRAGTSWYFAEGTTRSNFREWLCLMNPGSRDTTAIIQYSNASGPVKTVATALGANSRTTIDVNAEVGPDQDVSTLVTSTDPIVAERPMYFQFIPMGGGMWKGGHNSLGAGYQAYKWEFAEGCTRGGFQTYLCISNPNGSDVNATVDYYVCKSGGGSEKKSTTVGIPANSRQTILVNDVIGGDCDVSSTVTCASPIVVERPMYFDFGGYVDGGDVMGLPGSP